MEEKTEVVDKKPHKLSYEELENVAHQLSDQSRELYNKLQEANMTNILKRLEYLFKVIENNTVFPKEFTDKCIDEIINIMTIPDVNEENTVETEKE